MSSKTFHRIAAAALIASLVVSGAGASTLLLPSISTPYGLLLQTPPAGGSTPLPTARPAGTQSFAQVQARANRVTKPLDAIVLWQQFIDSGVQGDDLEKAKAELQVWEDREADDAVLINRKWVGGADKTKITKEVESLIEEGRKMLGGNQALGAVEKFERAGKIWPENFQVQFFLGFLALQKEDGKKALMHFENCNRIDETSIEVLNNLGVGYFFDRKFEKSIQTFHKAVQYGDSKELAQNLITAIAASPEGLQRATRLKAARDAANLLGRKYNIAGPTNSFLYMMPGSSGASGAASDRAAKERKGVVGTGSGFVVTADGLIITNKHVAGAGKGLMVKFTDGTQRTAEVVHISEDEDLALIRVKSDTPMTFVQLTAYDNPKDGSNVVIMGYPAPERFGYTVKTTQGAVASGNNPQGGYDITLDARANPGNSGGPVYDGLGNVMGVLSAGTTTDDSILNSYSLAISAGRVRKFLAKHDITLEPASGEGSTMTVEQISEKNRMATVCIVIVN
jgi:S1-C subfamily serine protease